MKELLHTGFMSNRGRQNVASYFVHNLQQDWRIGAAWFESQLIDYDVASNWGNWMYVAGVGNDPRQDRVFNTKNKPKCMIRMEHFKIFGYMITWRKMSADAVLSRFFVFLY